jgi:hypothetical protein
MESSKNSRISRILGVTFAAVACSATASFATTLYGIGRTLNADVFYQIDTTSGAATPLFGYGNAGTTGTFGLTYNPVSNRFLTIQQSGTSSSTLIEIDATTSTAAAVVHGIPTNFFEGIEYSAALGGIVVSYGPGGNFSGRLALLDSSYNLIANNPSTGMLDCDTLYVDSAGALNMLDTNHPHGGWQRNSIANPFGSISINVNGPSNPYAFTDTDFAWKADIGRLYLSRQSQLSHVVGPNNIFTIGAYGGAAITGLAVGPNPSVPEPTAAAVALIACVATRRRR